MIDITSVWALLIFAVTAGALRLAFEFEDVLERRCMIVAVLAAFVGFELQAYGFDDTMVGGPIADLAAAVGIAALIGASIGGRKRRRLRPRLDGDGFELPREFVTRPQVQREVDRIVAASGCRSGAAFDRRRGWIDVHLTVGILGYLACNHLRAVAELSRVARRYGPAVLELDVEVGVVFWHRRWILGGGGRLDRLEAETADALEQAQAAHMRGERAA